MDSIAARFNRCCLRECPAGGGTGAAQRCAAPAEVERHVASRERKDQSDVSAGRGDVAARSSRRNVTRNKNRTPVMMRLRLQMLMPVSAKCTWNRRMLG